MKLAIVADELDPTNGWGRYAGELARGLIAAGVDVRLVTPGGTMPADLRAHHDHAPIPSFRDGTPHFARLLARTIRPLRRALRGVDAVHCMVEPYAPAVALAAGLRPLFVSLVGTYSVPSSRVWLESRLLRLAMRRARRLIAISRYTEQRVRRDTGFTHSTVVPLAVRANEFAVPDPPPAREAGLVVAVGEPKPRKGFDVALEAFAAVRARLPQSRFVIVGPYAPSSSFVARLRERIHGLGLEDDVILTGAVSHDELVRWYARASVVVMPYRSVGRDFEGFGLVLLEAGACGAPVISSLDSPAEEIVAHAETGLLVAPGDVTALETAMLQVLTSADECRRLGAGGKARAATMTWERSTAQLIDVYEQTLSRPIRRGS